MDNQNLNNPVGNSSPSFGSVPEPPKDSSVDVRTMPSDIQSVKQSGGGSPEPRKFNLSEINQPASSVPPTPDSSNNQSSPFGAGFPSPSNIGEQSFVPGQNQIEITENPSAKSVDWKKIILIVVAVVAVGLLGYVGYAYIYPMFFPASAPVVEETIPSSVLPETEPVTQEEVVAPAFIHSSYLNTSSLGSLPFSLTTFKTDLATLLKPVGLISASSTVSEFSIQKNNSQMKFSEFFNSLFPGLSQETLENYFEEDFTAFAYYDADFEVWPGFIAKLKTDSNLFDAESAMKLIEISSDFSNVFVENQGERISPDFLDGQINSVPTRYITFTNKKAAIDYMWMGNYFIISSSYPGLKAVVPLINP
ncbi:MAG: hypothetical protein PHZ25_00625 [Candidatus Pacebacteria bacterium]|nr:hypothetical protein [Candidatus Paceibacterota bacterium]